MHRVAMKPTRASAKRTDVKSRQRSQKGSSSTRGRLVRTCTLAIQGDSYRGCTALALGLVRCRSERTPSSPGQFHLRRHLRRSVVLRLMNGKRTFSQPSPRRLGLTIRGTIPRLLQHLANALNARPSRTSSNQSDAVPPPPNQARSHLLPAKSNNGRGAICRIAYQSLIASLRGIPRFVLTTGRTSGYTCSEDVDSIPLLRTLLSTK